MPIMRITSGKLRPGSWDQFEIAYRQAVEQAAGVPGLLGRSLVRDTSDPDAGFSISLWENVAVMETHKASAFADKLNGLLEPYYLGDYHITVCEVRYTDVLKGGSAG